jgi:hypothetical protein
MWDRVTVRVCVGRGHVFLVGTGAPMASHMEADVGSERARVVAASAPPARVPCCLEALSVVSESGELGGPATLGGRPWNQGHV